MLPTLEQLTAFDKPVPRYTSYPTAPEWGAVEPSLYASHLSMLGSTDKPVSLYFHIPFCKTMCLYCACSVVLNRKQEVEDEYVEYLLREIELVSSFIGTRKRVVQLHFGGGTPTKLQEKHFLLLMDKIRSHFELDPDAEIAIEIDPRTVYEDDSKKLSFLRHIGFNRVSFGVQDLDQKVQEAVRRRQSYEMTKQTFDKARELGFQSINIDLIYGLPFQTEQSFQKTVEGILTFRPDRIALFSYAKVPWLKPHQKAIADKDLPSTDEKFGIYTMARASFIAGGYQAIGMDHFALLDDELARSYRQKTLHRNFQGYTVSHVEDLVSFGITAIGFVQGAFFQNLKELQPYYASLNDRIVPLHRGKVLSQDDVCRRWVIQKIMCDFKLDKREFLQRYGIPFNSYFPDALVRLESLLEQGLVEITEEALLVTSLGELFVRVVASAFDWYYNNPSGHKMFSKGI